MAGLTLGTPRLALVVGGTGLVGSHLLSLLAEDPRYERILHFGRHRPKITCDKLEARLVDFDRPDAFTDISSDSSVPIHGFCCLGTTIRKAGSKETFRRVDFDYVLQFANACKEQQANSLAVVSAAGAHPRAPFFYSRVKGEIEQALIELKLPSLTILRPSLLLGERDEPRFFEDLAKPLSHLMIGPLARWQGIQAFDVARAMLIAAESPQPGTSILTSAQIRNLTPLTT